MLRLTVYEGPSPQSIIEPPEFTLYADGRAIYAVKFRARDELRPSFELHLAQLSNEQLNALVADALGPGGLRDARAEYDIRGVIHREWNYFDVHAEGIDKEVRVFGLDYEPAPDAAERAKFAGLAARLLNVPAEVDAGRAAYGGRFQPTAYDAFLNPGGPADHLPVSADWPWPDLEPVDFGREPDGTIVRRLTQLQGEAVIDLGIDEYVIAEAPDGETYSIRIRPLLPDEAAKPGPVWE